MKKTRKDKRMEIRLSEIDDFKLDYCCEMFKLNKSEVVRLGIEQLYEKVRDKI